MWNEEIKQVPQDTEGNNTAPANFANVRNVSPIPVIPELGVAFALLFIVFGIAYISTPGTPATEDPEDVYVDARLSEASLTSGTSGVFEDLVLHAESAVVWDVKEQRMLFTKNADEPLPLASITKLMTALVAYELIDPEERITISHDVLRVEGDSGFTEGESFSMQKLTDLTLISSSNDGAAALGATVAESIDDARDPEAVFVRAMNLKAKELGLSQTQYKNNTGLDISSEEAGAYGSARDTARLMEHILLHTSDALALTSLEITRIDNDRGEYHLAKNTNEVAHEIDGLIASKTGYTSLAGGNLAVAFNAGLDHPIIVVVLGSTYHDRFSDTLTLVEKTQEYLANK